MSIDAQLQPMPGVTVRTRRNGGRVAKARPPVAAGRWGEWPEEVADLVPSGLLTDPSGQEAGWYARRIAKGEKAGRRRAKHDPIPADLRGGLAYFALPPPRREPRAPRYGISTVLPVVARLSSAICAAAASASGKLWLTAIFTAPDATTSNRSRAVASRSARLAV